MKRQRREDTARAEMYDDGWGNLVEYMEQYVSVRPGACDETFGGGRARRPKVSPIVARRAPTKPIPDGPNMLLTPSRGRYRRYRIRNEIVDIDTKFFRVQRIFTDGSPGYYINPDSEYDKMWFEVRGG